MPRPNPRLRLETTVSDQFRFCKSVDEPCCGLRIYGPQLRTRCCNESESLLPTSPTKIRQCRDGVTHAGKIFRWAKTVVLGRTDDARTHACTLGRLSGSQFDRRSYAHVGCVLRQSSRSSNVHRSIDFPIFEDLIAWKRPLYRGGSARSVARKREERCLDRNPKFRPPLLVLHGRAGIRCIKRVSPSSMLRHGHDDVAIRWASSHDSQPRKSRGKRRRTKRKDTILLFKGGSLDCPHGMEKSHAFGIETAHLKFESSPAH